MGDISCMAGLPERIVSGGQTGADRAAFDAALQAGIEVGGWVPRGRLAEDGIIPDKYPNLIETETDDPNERTRLNVAHSHGTVVVVHGPPQGGTAYAVSLATEMGKPLLILDLDKQPVEQAAVSLKEWLAENAVEVLNVAGPRASEDAEIYPQAYRIISDVLKKEGSI